MKELIYIFISLLVIGSFIGIIEASQPVVIAQDSLGLEVQIKEKYGPTIIDSGTVLMLWKNNFILLKRSGVRSWYPVANHSVKVLERKKK